MAGNSTAVGVAADSPEKALVQPTLSASEAGEYRRLCKKVGVRVPEAELHDTEVELLLERLGIPVYNLEKVHKCMGRSADERRKDWYWIPLRERDRETSRGVRYPVWQRRENGQLAGTVRRDAVYAKLIPLSVLATVEKILDAAPEGLELCFLVSDYEVARPDPFLALATWSGGFWVIDFWNEPSFRP